MEAAFPSKRARYDFPVQVDDDCYKISSKSYSGTSESLAGSSGESTLTSDSGFNELTPPQSFDDDGSMAGSSQSHIFDSVNFQMKIARHDRASPLNEDNQEGNEDGEEDDEDDDACSVASTTSQLSGLSDLSNISGKDWKPCAGPMSWVQQQMTKGVNPRSVLTQILGGSWQIPEGVSDFMLWHIIVNMLSEPPKRERLRHINTLEDVIRLIKVCRKIIVLTGAGVSVSCGIPDFRSKDGIYTRLAVDFPDLPDPQAMFDINYFRRDPRPFFKFAREIYPGQFKPSLCHRFIRLLEQNNKILRNYTQNIDTLEQVAGIKRVIQCHGSFATATCQRCSTKVDAEVIKEDIFSQRIPMCALCSKGPSATENGFATHHGVSSTIQKFTSEGKLTPCSSRDHVVQKQYDANHPQKNTAPDPVMKPDIVFFGEGLPDEFHDRMAEDKDECDLLIVIGSSLKVRPVALIPSSIPPNVPQILINREPLGHLTFDVELLGDCDVIVSELCRRLGDSWNNLSVGEPLSEIQELPPRSEVTLKVGENDSLRNSQNTLQNAPHPKDESDIEALRACWAPKVKESMAARLPENKYLFCGGHRYVFPGAEVLYDPDDEDSDSRSSESDSEEDDVENTLASTTGNIQVEDSAPTNFHPRLFPSPESTINADASSALISGRRRSSKAFSEDVDSLLSTPSCEPANNTPDHPSEGQWVSSDQLNDLHCHVSQTTSVEDWTSLSASLDASSMSAHIDGVESHFECPKDGKELIGKIEKKEKCHQTECRV